MEAVSALPAPIARRHNRRAEFFYQQLDALRELRQAVRKDLLAESRKQSSTKLLRQDFWGL